MNWISIDDSIPLIEDVVIARTHYIKLGKHFKETVIGYMDEYGDLVTIPDDQEYGFSFNDVVTHWMPLPEPPKSKQP